MAACEWSTGQQQLQKDVFGDFLMKQRPVKEAVSNSNGLFKQHLLHKSIHSPPVCFQQQKEAFGLFEWNFRRVAP